KDALLREGVREIFTEFNDVLNSPATSAEPFGSRLERAFGGLGRAVVRDRELARAVISSGAWASWINPQNPGDELLTGIFPARQAFTTAQREGTLRTDLDPQHISQLVWGSAVIVIAQWVTREA